MSTTTVTDSGTKSVSQADQETLMKDNNELQPTFNGSDLTGEVQKIGNPYREDL